MAAKKRPELKRPMAEIMLALRAKYLANVRAGIDTETEIPLAEFGKKATTREALQAWKEGHYIQIVNGMVRFAGQGFNEAFRIEEDLDNPKPERQESTQPALFNPTHNR